MKKTPKIDSAFFFSGVFFLATLRSILANIFFLNMAEHVKEYYGEVLQKSEDLKTNACCTVAVYPKEIKEILSVIHEEVVCDILFAVLFLPSLSLSLPQPLSLSFHSITLSFSCLLSHLSFFHLNRC